MYTVIITGSTTLRLLNVSHNDISDDGMAVMSELQHNKSLTTLKVVQCGLSVKGTEVCTCVFKMYFLMWSCLTPITLCKS